TAVFKLFLSSNRGDFSVYAIRKSDPSSSANSLYNIIYYGYANNLRERMTNHKKTKKKFYDIENVEFGVILNNLEKEKAELLEALLIMSYNIYAQNSQSRNEKFEQKNLFNEVMRILKKDEDYSTKVKELHKLAISLLKEKE
ncbi:hypothetical protein Mgra_00009292, partial [Meloidogyne graminicola]